MKAVLCKSFGPAENLVLEEIASPEPKKNEILLDVHAAGVNFPDTLIIEGKYQFKPPLPFTPGVELAEAEEDLTVAEEAEAALRAVRIGRDRAHVGRRLVRRLALLWLALGLTMTMPAARVRQLAT